MSREALLPEIEDVLAVSQQEAGFAASAHAATGLAVAGLPKVLEMLKDGDAEPIWNLSDAIDTLLCKEKAA